MNLHEMIAADLDVLWVVGANPLRTGAPRKAGFVVVQDMFLTETAAQADVVLPAASAYEKNGTVTNTTGEVQRLKRAIQTMGAKPDLEIMGFIAREMGAAAALGPWTPDVVFDEIHKNVRGYAVPDAADRDGRGADHAGERAHSRGGSRGAGPLRSQRAVRVRNARTIFEGVAFRRGRSDEPLMDSFIVITLIKTLVVFGVLMTTLAYLQWVERKVIAHIQVRPGPYRVGPHGLLQPLADVIKLITKEDLVPPYVNKPLYLLAPFLAITMALLSISVIPFGPKIEVAGYETLMQLTDLNIGVLFILAVSSMGVYGIALAGWSSNNKYALIGGLRSSAQMISYELPMSLAIAAPLLISNTLSLRELVDEPGGSILALEHPPRTLSASLQLHHFHHCRVRRNQPRAVRSSGSRKRAGGRLPHRVQQHEVRLVLHGRVRQHDHRELHGDAAVSGRLDAAVARAVRVQLCARGDFRWWPDWSRCITDCTPRGGATGSRFPPSGLFF